MFQILRGPQTSKNPEWQMRMRNMVTWIDASQCFLARSWSPTFAKASAIVSSAYILPHVHKNTTYVYSCTQVQVDLDTEFEQRQMSNLTCARALLYGCLNFKFTIPKRTQEVEVIKFEVSYAIVKNIPIDGRFFPVWCSQSRQHINMGSTTRATSMIYVQTDTNNLWYILNKKKLIIMSFVIHHH